MCRDRRRPCEDTARREELSASPRREGGREKPARPTRCWRRPASEQGENLLLVLKPVWDAVLWPSGQASHPPRGRLGNLVSVAIHTLVQPPSGVGTQGGCLKARFLSYLQGLPGSSGVPGTPGVGGGLILMLATLPEVEGLHAGWQPENESHDLPSLACDSFQFWGAGTLTLILNLSPRGHSGRGHPPTYRKTCAWVGPGVAR